MQIVKDGKFVQILMPEDNQYQYLLGLVLKGGAQGAWAKKQLNEIHKQLGEIGRSQVAWNEYKAKGMTKEMDGAHVYAEKVRGILKDKYDLSSAMVDGIGYLHLWTGAGPAGNYLRVQETENIGSVTNLSTADEYRQAIIDEAIYWVGKIPYCRDSKITTQVLDRNNPPPYMDCSDFTSSVYKTLLDINIGATTRDQIKRGTEVAFNDLKPGDLVLFSNNKTSVPDHVGIYIGDGKFIHEVGNNVNPNNLTNK
ncbi:putative endopeptidase YafL precursor [compost metagenome]